MTKEKLIELLLTKDDFIGAEDLETGEYLGYFGYDVDEAELYFCTNSYMATENEDFYIWTSLENGAIALLD